MTNLKCEAVNCFLFSVSFGEGTDFDGHEEELSGKNRKNRLNACLNLDPMPEKKARGSNHCNISTSSLQVVVFSFERIIAKQDEAKSNRNEDSNKHCPLNPCFHNRSFFNFPRGGAYKVNDGKGP